jgi:hypothetical protein
MSFLLCLAKRKNDKCSVRVGHHVALIEAESAREREKELKQRVREGGVGQNRYEEESNPFRVDGYTYTFCVMRPSL